MKAFECSVLEVDTVTRGVASQNFTLTGTMGLKLWQFTCNARDEQDSEWLHDTALSAVEFWAADEASALATLHKNIKDFVEQVDDGLAYSEHDGFAPLIQWVSLVRPRALELEAYGDVVSVYDFTVHAMYTGRKLSEMYNGLVIALEYMGWELPTFVNYVAVNK